MLLAVVGSSSPPGQDGLLSRLQRNLHLAGAGAFRFDLTRETRALDPQDVERCRRYVAEAASACWGRTLARENPSLAAENEALIRQTGGSALRESIQPPPGGHVFGEVLMAEGKHALVEKYSLPDGALREEQYIWSTTERISWIETDGVRRPTYVSPADVEKQPFAPGVLSDIFYKLARAQRLLQVALDADLIAAGDESLSWRVDLDSWSIRDRFKPPFGVGHGVMELPGSVRVTFERIRDVGWQLHCEWMDCGGGRLLEDRVVWSGDESLPRQVETVRWAPGVAYWTEDERTLFTPVGSGSLSVTLEWIPHPGDTVYDRRSGNPVRYQVAPDGSVPIRLGTMEGPTDAGAASSAGASPLVVPADPFAATTKAPTGGISPYLVWGSALAASALLALLVCRRAR